MHASDHTTFREKIMWNSMEWFLEKMKLSDEEEMEDVEDEGESDESGALWYEKYVSKKTQEKTLNNCIFSKKVNTYDDAKEVITEYRAGAECVIIFDQSENADSQGMLNYVCGGVYALDGYIREAGGNVFVISHAEVKEGKAEE